MSESDENDPLLTEQIAYYRAIAGNFEDYAIPDWHASSALFRFQEAKIKRGVVADQDDVLHQRLYLVYQIGESGGVGYHTGRDTIDSRRFRVQPTLWIHQ